MATTFIQLKLSHVNPLGISLNIFIIYSYPFSAHPATTALTTLSAAGTLYVSAVILCSEANAVSGITIR
jgi:hypothetical protein